MVSNNVIYVIFMDGCCKCGNLLEVFRLLDEMRVKGLLCDGYVYNFFIDGCFREGNMEKVFCLF